ncbi:MAG: 2-succinyl-5-enolpyruvyl-6-hydroxy-3-cyclohexene-1-carboxylate synthase [Owenweeksia sp. TMED14]|nr:MAG: 2-succinyl-5-enolpyruvyl-6-hydroxy-3-cyclohexene-1-carboxylate synthase [Owenweeksia sp. TMED14]
MRVEFQPLSALIGKFLDQLDLAAWVGSPGSRNAPLMEAFSSLEYPQAIMLDERSAGYFALGAAMKMNKPVALVCTSGTAALNYAPAVAEAFYQKIPLLIITADRPKEFIDNGHGQSIRQEKIYEGHIRASALLNPEISLEKNADLLATALIHLEDGPVHVNVPIKEPLYGVPHVANFSIKLKEKVVRNIAIADSSFPVWLLKAKYPLLIVGQWNPEWGSIKTIIKNLSEKGWLIAGEHLSQLTNGMAVNLDEVWNSQGDSSIDAVVSVGGAWISKESKKRLLDTPHLHIAPSGPFPNMFGNLRSIIESSPVKGLEFLLKKADKVDDNWLSSFRQCSASKPQVWSDLWVHYTISRYRFHDHDIHWANSTSVRYGIHTWAHGGWENNARHYSNRGTSGIDGCTSTSIGSAWLSGKRTILITGELAFFYDSNAFLNNHIPVDFKVIVMNNGGGDIFRRLPGAIKSGLFESHFNWKHKRSVKDLVSYAGLEYFCASSIEEWKVLWPKFIGFSKPSVFEIITDSVINDEVWNDRFEF